jgi:predicted RNA-binding protein with PIN domain
MFRFLSFVVMHLIIDGYNLLHVSRSLNRLNSIQLQWERDRLVDQLSAYQKLKPCRITIVFDGWQGGWNTEKTENKKGIEVIYSKLGEKADEVIKRLVKEKGSGAIVITSDRDVGRFAERMSVAVIPSEEFREKLELSGGRFEESFEEEEEEEKEIKKKGLSRRLSKKEKRARVALKKL